MHSAVWLCSSNQTTCLTCFCCCCFHRRVVLHFMKILTSLYQIYCHLISGLVFCVGNGRLPSVDPPHPHFLRMFFWLVLLRCFSAATFTVARTRTVKTEKKTVQFSEDIQVETIEPEQEPVYIDEVSSLTYSAWSASLKCHCCVNKEFCVEMERFMCHPHKMSHSKVVTMVLQTRFSI